MLLKITGLKKKFKDHEVLNGIDLEIEPGQIVGLLDSNGAGKSTLMKCINDLLVPDEGEILVNGIPFNKNSHLLISYLPEKTYLDPSWKAKNAIDFFAKYYPDFDRNKAMDLLKDLDLNPEQEIKNMSKGMQEKLQLALVMSRNARLYMLDEPLGGVDPVSRDRILDTILSHFSEESSMIISTHMISEIERILDRALILQDGKNILDENAEELRARTGHSVNEEFREVYRS